MSLMQFQIIVYSEIFISIGSKAQTPIRLDLFDYEYMPAHDKDMLVPCKMAKVVSKTSMNKYARSVELQQYLLAIQTGKCVHYLNEK